MLLKINNIKDFFHSIYNYIIESQSIIPRDFNTTDKFILSTAYIYTPLGNIKPFNCFAKRNQLHVHDVDENIYFCTDAEKLAIQYIQQSIFGNKYVHELITTLHEWLPIVSYNQIDIKFNKKNVESYFFPQLVLKIDKEQTLNYTYIYSTPFEKYTNLNINKSTIIIMARRYRSRSRSPSTRRRSRSRSSSAPYSTSTSSRRRPGRPRRSGRPTNETSTSTRRRTYRSRSRSRSRSQTPYSSRY